MWDLIESLPDPLLIFLLQISSSSIVNIIYSEIIIHVSVAWI